MDIIEKLKGLLQGRGFFASFLVISGWFYVGIILCVLICNVFLLAIGKKYHDKNK